MLKTEPPNTPLSSKAPDSESPLQQPAHGLFDNTNNQTHSSLTTHDNIVAAEDFLQRRLAAVIFSSLV